MNIESCSINFDSIPWNKPVEGARSKEFLKDGKKVRIVEFTDKFIEPDWCIKGHIGYVIEGEMEIEFSNGVKNYKAGDGLFILAGEENKHRHFSTIKTTTLFLVEDA